MALIGRLVVVIFGFFAACAAAAVIIFIAVMFPEFSQLGAGPVHQGVLDVLFGFSFILVSGFALLPAALVIAVTEAFYIRRALTYAVGGALLGLACYLGLVLNAQTLRFDGIVHRHLEIMTAAGIVAGLVYWIVAGHNAGAWRAPPRRLPRLPPMPSASRPPPPR
jgi:hypothetical protein